jgi:bzd-type benzoyl-CoA reductase Q subunit
VNYSIMAGKEKSTFWKWPASSWRSPRINWKAARFITVGVDVGSVSAQAVIMADGEILAYGNMHVGADGADSATKVYRLALQAGGDLPENRFDYCIGTGYGRVNVPFADRTVTEIACHARGAHLLYGSGVRTVLDVGGQDIKAIQCDEKGKVVNFLMNDKCAAGTGRGIEVFMDLLGIPITDAGDRSFHYPGEEPGAVSNTCVVYAKSEALALRRKGWTLEQVLAAYFRAAAERIYSLLERAGVKPAFAVTGGMAKNRGVMERLMPMIGLDAMKTSWDPQIAGAAGAALFGHTLCCKGKTKRR